MWYALACALMERGTSLGTFNQDDARELKVIKDALREHLKIDAMATFQVISESCTTSADITAEEQSDRRQLQAVVLSFLVECIKEKTHPELSRNLQEALLKVSSSSLIIRHMTNPSRCYLTRTKVKHP